MRYPRSEALKPAPVPDIMRAPAGRSAEAAGWKMNAFRVPKRRATLELVLLDGSVIPADVFLSERASLHHGPERVSDLLVADTLFLPALVHGSDSLTCFNTASISYVKTDAAAEPADDHAHTIPTEHEVDVHLNSGQLLRGLITYVLPVDHSRLSDYLNERHPFIRLLVDGQVLLVNKRHVCRVAPVNKD